VFSEWTQV